jgi:hypothetical protein
LDLTRYSTLKAQRLITLSKVNDAHVATLKRYSQEDGRESAPETAAIDSKKLEAVIAIRKQELESLTELLHDLP